MGPRMGAAAFGAEWPPFRMGSKGLAGCPLRTGSGIPAAGPSIIPLLIGEARPEGGVIRRR
jgi:hypothetical protein